VKARYRNSFKAVIVVAHPDDETIWSGGLILRHPDWDWAVLSLCRADDPDRSPKFERMCKSQRVTGFISDLDDGDPLTPISPRREIGHRIMETVGDSPWDLCVTHGRNGEYGHLRHKEVHAEVLSLIADGILECAELWTFAYDCDSATRACRPGPNADLLVELTEEQLAEKKRIVQEVYGYDEDSFEVRACVSPECYQKHPITEQE